ncbi:hypothetical protein G5I_08023 [Acromyrmex echinatior]|uniref:Uncharacterized protein n=1 Tax=Acromyrmex echinatior TaxID=103372 RepID=F4WQD5_ACREC|nr:hypothetical protein G5I_08023 [Acromyrmex echinatior]
MSHHAQPYHNVTAIDLRSLGLINCENDSKQELLGSCEGNTIVYNPGVRAIKRQLRDDDGASASKRKEEEEEKEKEEEKEGEKASKMFERSATLDKFDDRSHDRVQYTLYLHSAYDRTNDRIIG